MSVAEICLAQLCQIATAVKMVSEDRPTVCLGCRVSVGLLARLAELPGAVLSATAWDGARSLNSEPYVIESVRVVVDGVTFEAQRTRPLTAQEAGALAARPAEQDAPRRWMQLVRS